MFIKMIGKQERKKVKKEKVVMDIDVKDLKFNKKSNKHNIIVNMDNTNGILIAILHELKDINKTLTKHDIVINNHETRITKLEEGDK